MTEPAKTRARPGKARPLFAAALAMVALTAAACSGSGSSSSSSDTSRNSAALAYAKCMRSHGVTDFPDPNAQGGFSAPNGMNPNSATYKSASNSCKSLDSSTPPPVSASNAARLLEYAQCMRAHGIADFPDPNSQGHLNVGGNKNHPDLEPGNPQYMAANKACQADLPGGG